jgi:hypothetical protein
MPSGVRAFLAVAAACSACALPASASATTPYDPDASGLSPTPSTDLSVGSGVCTFDTVTGAISGAGCPSARGAGGDGTVVNGIGVFFIPSPTLEQASTTEFVMNSLNAASGALIKSNGGRSLVIATLHDLTVASGASVNLDGAGQQGGSHADGEPGFRQRNSRGS